MEHLDDEQALIAELAQLVVGRAAPDELEVFDETAEEYFADPQAALAASGQDAAVGFGLDLAMMTPVILAVGGAVVQALAGSMADKVVQQGQRVAVSWVRRLLHKEKQDQPVTISAAQAQHVRQVALQRARSLGLAEDQASLLADSFVGALAVA